MAAAAARVFSVLARRVADLEPVVRAGGNAEALHDLRVAVRRARAALRIFSSSLPAALVKSAARDLREMGRSLGPARDADVLIGNARQRLKELPRTDRDQLAPLLVALQRERDAAHVAVGKFLAGPRSKGARKSLRLLARPPLRSGPRVRDAAPAVIGARLDKAHASLGRVRPARPRPSDLHDVRIRLKELRYALEFLGSALEGGVAPILQQLREIQDELGAIQDGVVEEARVEEAARGLGLGAQSKRALGALVEATRRDRNSRLKRAPELVAEIGELLGRARALTSR